MSRVKRGYKGNRRRKKLLEKASGFRGTRSKLYKVAVNVVKKALSYAYRDRKQRKRDFRQLWVVRINAASRLNGTTYGRFMHGLKKANITIDRKMLAALAVEDQNAFGALVKLAASA